MVLKEEQERLQMLLREAIPIMCKNGVPYKAELSIEALIGVTIDRSEVFLISLRETFQNENDVPELENDTLAKQVDKFKAPETAKEAELIKIVERQKSNEAELQRELERLKARDADIMKMVERQTDLELSSRLSGSESPQPLRRSPRRRKRRRSLDSPEETSDITPSLDVTDHSDFENDSKDKLRKTLLIENNFANFGAKYDTNAFNEPPQKSHLRADSRESGDEEEIFKIKQEPLETVSDFIFASSAQEQFSSPPQTTSVQNDQEQFSNTFGQQSNPICTTSQPLSPIGTLSQAHSFIGTLSQAQSYMGTIPPAPSSMGAVSEDVSSPSESRMVQLSSGKQRKNGKGKSTPTRSNAERMRLYRQRMSDEEKTEAKEKNKVHQKRKRDKWSEYKKKLESTKTTERTKKRRERQRGIVEGQIQSVEWQRHKQVSNPPMVDVNIHCLVCGKTHRSSSSMFQHIICSHLDKEDYEKNNCTMCQIVYKRKYALRTHITQFHMG